jgi:RsiW-degrading membrane proteinase PrsW (M82 family)
LLADRTGGWPGTRTTAGFGMINRNVLYLVIGGLAVATAVLGFWYYQERQKTGIDINIGKSGISIEKR